MNHHVGPSDCRYDWWMMSIPVIPVNPHLIPHIPHTFRPPYHPFGAAMLPYRYQTGWTVPQFPFFIR
ncbi:hypothetical protein [Desmospora profundinema]|uniref:Uncharacterized protein n=1 Tax=Desmospora profundinema TaxID=1571184 RepID=A0ABU1IIU2_9BACL|nr:hypothetical protein [Desmospora profundinema]MDR6224690.1 hypothetical protein [Desmospora profundinema]